MFQVLDHGYVDFVEAWGRGKDARARISRTEITSESSAETVYDPDYEIAIIEAARQSTQGAFRGWERDQRLLEFLFTSKPQHAGPFEFSGMTIEVQAPLIVFREWHRHRTQSYNEMSARYAPLPDLYYGPSLTNVLERAEAAKKSKNRQEQGTGVDLSEQNAIHWLEQVDTFYTRSEELYQWALKVGIPKELARITMPVGHYSRMRATGNLRNWLHFLLLRMDPAAQWEIRQFAEIVGKQIISKYFPRTWALFKPE